MVKREAKCTLIQEGVKLKKNLRTGMTCLKCHRNTAEVFADCVINCTCPCIDTYNNKNTINSNNK